MKLFPALLGLSMAAALTTTPALAQTKKTKPAATAKTAKPAAPALTTDKAKMSHIVGHQIGASLIANGLDVDLSIVTQALADELKGIKSSISPEETQRIMQAYQQVAQAKMQEKQNQLAAGNIEACRSFLAENGKKPGVVTLPSGLQYLVEKEGAGASPKITDQVKVNYRGTLLDGKEFDSSYKRGQPAQFGCGQVIKGWTEALQLMKPGAKWKLFIPSDLAYGNQGAGQDIPPGAALIFDVELLEIVPGTPAGDAK